MAAQDNGNWFKLYRGILDNTAWAQRNLFEPDTK